jgi:MFS transporter, DHA2 family, methylenomycin A resistance protein
MADMDSTTAETIGRELSRPVTEQVPGRRAGLILLVMCAGMFLVLLDVTVVNVAVPTITTSLHTGTAGVQWVVDAYTVTLASLLLSGGILGDRFGRRKVVLTGLVIFGVASAGCALAPVTGALITARAVQGIGAALLLPGSVAAIADAYPDRAAQARALGIWASVSSLALPAGPLLGGLIVQTFGWRVVFWINPPVVALCITGVLTWARPAPGRQARRLDVPGLALATVGLAAAVYAVIAAGGTGSMTAIATAGAVAVIAVAGFVWVEVRVDTPILPLRLFRNSTFRAANTAALVMNLTSIGMLFLLTRYLQSVLGYRALMAGVLLLPLFVPVVIMSPPAGRLTARRGPRPAMFAGAALYIAGQLCLLLVTPASGYLRVLPALLGVSFGLGMFTAPVVSTSIRAVPPAQSGLASGVNNTARQVGTALGVAIFGALAGSPADTHHFVTTMRVLGAAAAIAWLVILALIAVGVTAKGSRRSVRDNGDGT